ncbi:MAG: metallophosphoesterase [Deltaproteobacteria bacterium]|nr:metallophosphoesterase [Deltaproteobacteria bacterium]
MFYPLLVLSLVGGCVSPILLDDALLEGSAVVSPGSLPAPQPVLPVPQDLAQAARAAAEGSNLAPAPWGPGPVLGVVPVGQAWYPNRHALRWEEEAPAPVSIFGLPFVRAPWAALEGGELVVRWETREPSGPGALYAGIPPESDPLAPPRFTARAAEPPGEPRTAHEVRLPLDKRVLDPVIDADQVLERSWGTLVWRLIYPWQGHFPYADGRTSFHLEDGAFAQAPTITLGPMISRLAKGERTVWFETDVPTTAALGVGGRAPLVSSTPSTRHEIRVGDLPPDALLAYQIAVSDGIRTTLSPYNTFRTRDPAAPVRVAILSDSRGGEGPGLDAMDGVAFGPVQTLLQAAARDNAQAIVFPGDLIDGYSTDPDDYERQLRTWLHAAEGVQASVPIFTGMGNHEALLQAWTDGATLDREGDLSGEASFARLMVNPSNGPLPVGEGAPPYLETVYSFDLGQVHVAMLNTNYWRASRFKDPEDPRRGGRGNREGLVRQEQMDWLEADLSAASAAGAVHLIVTGHEGAFPTGPHARDGMWWGGEVPEINAARERLWRILADAQAVAYVAGDDHHYSRSLIGAETVAGLSRPVWSVITGGAGAPWYAVAPPEAYAARLVAGSPQLHYTLWSFDGPEVQMQAISITGEVLDSLRLWKGEEGYQPLD